MKSRIAGALALALVTAAVVAARQTAPPQSDQPPVTFRVEVNLVEVDAFVTDAQGNAVPGLTASDFEVLEDRKPQKITNFSLVNMPIERAERPLFASAPIEPDVQTNRTVDGRIYLIVLDDLHTDATRTPRVKAALRQFIERYFGVNDMAATVYTSGRASDSQDFTNNPRLLLASIDKFLGRKLRSGTLEQIDEFNRRSGAGLEVNRNNLDPLEAERGFNARSTMTSLRKLAEFMGGVHGRRKAMILVGEGIDYNIYDVFNNQSATTVLDETREAIAAATRGNVAIYAIDPRGLTGLGDELIEISSVPTDTSLGLGLQSLQSELRLSQDSLRVLADETGGFASLNRNDFDQAFARIVRENSTYYVLGYYPANERRDGRYRKVEVRVKRPGLTVRARKGYVAPRGRAPQTRPTTGDPVRVAAAEALSSPIPVAGLPISVSAAAFKGTPPNATVAVTIELGGSAFTFTEKDGVFNDQLEVAFSAVDTTGKIYPGDRHAVAMTMKPDTQARVKERGFRVLSQMDLPAGRYQLRVAAAESLRSGSALYDLEVPDFNKTPVAMSGITLTSASAAQVPTVAPKDTFAALLPAPRSTIREFPRGDELALFAEFYENAPGAAPHMFDIEATIVDEEGHVIFRDSDERSSTELQGGRGGYGYSTRVMTGDFTPGLYVLHVEGRSRTAGPEAVARRDLLLRIK
jgi:VWFA-related protein